MLIFGASIVLNGYLIGVAIKTTQVKEDNTVLNLSQAATYMNLTEDELQGIIQTETDLLQQYHSFSGKMFPYFIVNDNFYFYKDEIDEWLIEATTQRHNYNTSKGWINSGPTE
jgi:hypothetical protein